MTGGSAGTKKHVLITGGAGFIGSHLCDHLLSKGYAVTAVDNLITGRKQNLSDALKHPDFDFIQADVSERFQDGKIPLIDRFGLFGVMHFACPASPVDFDRIPFEILAVDSQGTMHSVDLALKHRARYVVASTSEVYGDPLVHPQSEDYWGNVNTQGPRSCYDEAKRFSEAVVSTAISGKGRWNGKPYQALNAGIVRIFNTYGPRMRPDDGRIVPELCMQGLRGEPMTLHGDGSQTRSFCYVTDLVDGIIRLFESDVREAVNIGNPHERSVIEFAEVVRQLTRSKASVVHLPVRMDDPKRRCPDISKAKRLLGWSPKVDLEEGLRLSLEYFSNCP